MHALQLRFVDLCELLFTEDLTSVVVQLLLFHGGQFIYYTLCSVYAHGV